MIEVLDRHENIALELSGGKDSVAVLYLLKEELHRITVYFMDTGDCSPETYDVIFKCKQLCHHFVHINGGVRKWRRQHGMPFVVVPSSGINVHLAQDPDELQVVDQYTCCAENIMIPLHDRVLMDSNSLIIRGQKLSDGYKSPVRSGDVVDGVEFLFPLENKTDEEVMQYLKEVNAPVNHLYKHGHSLADCLGCTGWLDHISHPSVELAINKIRQKIYKMIEVRLASS